MKDEKDADKNQREQRSFHSRMRTKYSKSVEAGKSMHSRWNLGLLVESEGRLGREKKHEVLVGFGSKMFSFYAVLTLDIRHQIRVAGTQLGASWDSRAGSWTISFVKAPDF